MILRILLLSLVFFSCQQSDSNNNASSTTPESTQLTFTDVTETAGINFTHYNGSYGKKYFPEMAGPGGGWLDYDNDGWQDILLVQGKNWESNPGEDPSLKLYRNLGDGTFSDVTAAAGLDVTVYGMGMAAADYDNDGDSDLIITCVGPNKFFRNDGGKFTEVGEAIGVADPAWSASAMFFDYDLDGWLDLYVCNYVKWTEETDIWCSLDGKSKGYCTPEVYTGEPSRLYRNRGDGSYEDVTETSGIFNPKGKALGVALLDFNDDGWPDISIANDTQPDFLYKNNGKGADGKVTFSEIGLMSGFALDESGKARAGMGIDVGVVDHTGEETIFVGNFSNEMIGVYRDLGNGSYVDRAAVSQIGNASLRYLTFGVFLFDADLDFDLDLFGVNGHVQPEIEEIQQAVTFRQPSLLFENQGKGKFKNISGSAGEIISKPLVGRGCAYADYDRDGDLDILIINNNSPALLLRNELINEVNTTGPGYLRVKLEGTTSNRDAIGSRVQANISGKSLPLVVKTGSTYLSQSELILTFGTGSHSLVDSLTVNWPNGEQQLFQDIKTGQEILIREGEGIQ